MPLTKLVDCLSCKFVWITLCCRIWADLQSDDRFLFTRRHLKGAVSDDCATKEVSFLEVFFDLSNTRCFILMFYVVFGGCRNVFQMRK